MSYYGDDRLRPRGRSGVGDEFANSSRKPVMRKLRDGHKARVTVETGVEESRYRQEQSMREEVRREKKAVELAQFRSERQDQSKHRMGLYSAADSRRRHDPFSVKSAVSSPALRPSRPASTVPFAMDEPIEASLPADDSDDYADDYDFNLPRKTKAVHFMDDIAFPIPDSGSNDSSDKPHMPAKPKFSGQMTELLISKSQWVGNTFERGELGGDLSILPLKAEGSEKQHAPMMRWYHLERTMMSFEEFMAASQSVLEMPEKALRDVNKLLKDVQKKFEKQRHHGREMEPDCMSDVFYGDSADQTRQTASVMFLSFPYFRLEKYSSASIRALTPGSPLHPTRPMLQAQFYSTSSKRELAQAITSMPTTPAGECLHISQLWCLIVNGSTMVTCSRLSLDGLCGDIVGRSPTSSPDHHLQIKVSAGSNRSWLIPITPETSWPTFLAFFGEKVAGMEAQGFSAKFEYNKRAVDGSHWHDLIEAAKESAVELSLQDIRFDLKDADAQIAMEDVVSDEDENASDNEIPTNQSEGRATTDSHDPSIPIPRAPTMPILPSQTLQLFTNTGTTADLRGLADSLHKVLLSNERFKEKSAYRQCPSAQATDVMSWLVSDSRKANKEDIGGRAAMLRKPKRRIVSAAKYLFCTFWPLDFHHPMTDKFWGALHQILCREDEFYVQGHNDPRADVAEALSIYNVLHDEILPLASMLTQEFLTYEKDLQPLPDAFSKAFLHLVMAMVLTAQNFLTKKFSFYDSFIRKHLRAIPDELEAGKREITIRLHTTELEDIEICTESSVVALLVNQMSRDVMHGSPDVASSYSDFCQSMEFKVTEDPAPRFHQETIRSFLQEVEAVLALLQNQLSVIEVFQRSLEQQSVDDDDGILIYSLGESRQSVVIDDCKARIGGRIDKFKGLQQRAEELGEWHRNEMDSNKDRQESAILVFTIVTIIFLPLSFVASVFGMNTKDVRDMKYNQWAYWATGLPLTVVVVLGSLWWAGEFEYAGRWLANSMSRSRTSSGYENLQESATRVDGSIPPGRRPPRPRRRSRLGDRVYEMDVEESGLRPRRRTTYPLHER